MLTQGGSNDFCSRVWLCVRACLDMYASQLRVSCGGYAAMQDYRASCVPLEFVRRSARTPWSSIFPSTSVSDISLSLALSLSLFSSISLLSSTRAPLSRLSLSFSVHARACAPGQLLEDGFVESLYELRIMVRCADRRLAEDGAGLTVKGLRRASTCMGRYPLAHALVDTTTTTE